MLVAVVKALFWISDIVAWLLFIAATLIALATPFSGWVFAVMGDPLPTTWQLLGLGFGLLTIAAGAFLVTRRRIVGILLVQVPAIVWFLNGSYRDALIYFLCTLALFGVPFLLAVISVRHRNLDAQET